MKRRDFIIRTSQACFSAVSAVSFDIFAANINSTATEASSKPEISLAQWSLHRQIRSGALDPLDFALKAKNDFGISAVEYVNQFFMDRAQDRPYLQSMKTRADDSGVQSLLIMIDAEGPLGSPDNKERQNAIERHYKWVDAATFLGCHSIRVNLDGQSCVEDWAVASVDGLSRLCEFAAERNLNILVENHGGYSSNGKELSNVIAKVDMPNCGTLPDFGNFEDYDRYLGLEELMPFAKGVSAKSFDFDSDGNETSIDFSRMMKIVLSSGYKGHIGIEYEGANDDEDTGIMATKRLLERLIQNMV